MNSVTDNKGIVFCAGICAGIVCLKMLDYFLADNSAFTHESIATTYTEGSDAQSKHDSKYIEYGNRDSHVEVLRYGVNEKNKAVSEASVSQAVLANAQGPGDIHDIALALFYEKVNLGEFQHDDDYHDILVQHVRRNPAEIKSLISVFQTTTNPSVSETIVNILKEIDSPQISQFVLETLDSDDTEKALSATDLAAWKLHQKSELSDDIALKLLQLSNDNTSIELSYGALASLAHTNETHPALRSQIESRLTYAATDNRNYSLRARALESLVVLSNDKASTHASVFDALDSGNEELMYAAIQSLPQLPQGTIGNSIISDLNRIAGDQSAGFDIRLQSLQVLEQLNDN